MNLFNFLSPGNVKVRNSSVRVLIALLIILVNFHVPDLGYTTGIDSPLKWVFNHFLDSGMREGRDIIFPHGPLSFFNFPLPPNLLFVLIFQGILQLAMTLGIFKLVQPDREGEWLAPILISWVLVNLLNFYFLVLANISLAYLIHFHSRNNFFRYAGILLTAFACYIKVSSAMIALSITISFILLEWRNARRWSLLLRDGTVLFLCLLALWLLMFGSFSGFPGYFYGIFQLGMGNSEAMGLNPENHWLLITIFLCAILVLPFLQKTGEGTWFGLLFILSLFMAWKHGMAREDLVHNRIFFIYVFMLMMFFLLFNRKNLLVNVLIVGIGLTAFYWNLSTLPDFSPRRTEFFGINNFVGFIPVYRANLEKAASGTRKNLEANRLPDAIQQKIGQSTTDVYPWDYSIVPANGLNWRPRPVLQSFLAYTAWLEKQDIRHFESEDSPEYLVWDLDRITVDPNGGQWESVDTKYLLNDEPDLIIQLICRYHAIYKDGSFLVLKKLGIPLEYGSSIITADDRQWNQWMHVPWNEGDILRAKVRIRKNPGGILKSLFYKDEIVMASFRLRNGEEVSYRIVPDKCREGIWLDPFLFDKEYLLPGYRIDSMMFSSSNTHCMRDRIGIEWETIRFSDPEPGTVTNFFRMDTLSVE